MLARLRPVLVTVTLLLKMAGSPASAQAETVAITSGSLSSQNLDLGSFAIFGVNTAIQGRGGVCCAQLFNAGDVVVPQFFGASIDPASGLVTETINGTTYQAYVSGFMTVTAAPFVAPPLNGQFFFSFSTRFTMQGQITGTADPMGRIPLFSVLLTGSGIVTLGGHTFSNVIQNPPADYFATGGLITFGTDWTSTDVGMVGLGGTATSTNGTWTVQASGADIWGTADGFQFVHTTSSAAGAIAARIDSLQNTNPFAKAGLMIRHSLDAGSAMAILDVKPQGGIEFMVRPADGASVQFVGGTATSFPASPVWLRLRWGDGTIEAATSMDGAHWTFLAESGVVLPSAPVVGTAVTSHDDNQLTTATISSVTVDSSVAATWTTADIGDVGLAGNAGKQTGTWTLIGAGADIWGNHDAFRYVYRLARAGDLHVVVRVDDLSAMDTFAKAGIMIRNSSNDDASAIVLDVRPGGQIEFMSRPSTGADMVFLGTANVTFPVWLQLDWRGTSASKTVVASYSQDHVQWQLIGAPLTYAFPNAFDVGIVATSHDSTVTAAAHFTGLSVLPSNEWGDDIGATGIVGNASVDQMSPGGATTVEAAGADIWGTADSFYFVHQPQSPGQVMTSIRADVRATQPFAKAGLIVRDGLAPDAPTVILDVKPDGGIEFMARMCAGCPATFIAGTQIGVPARLRLSRDDNGMFSASVLSDDLSQTVNLGSVTVPMASPEGGYAVTSHDTTRLARGIFDDPPH